MSKEAPAIVVDMAMFKIIKKLETQIEKLKTLEKLYNETSPGKKAKMEASVIEQIERKVNKTLPKAEQRLEALKRAMYIMKDPTKWGHGDSA